MARKISEIETQIATVLRDELAKQGVQLNIDSWSATNIMRLLCYVFAVAAYYVEKLFDTHRLDLNTALDNRVPHSLRWYANMAKNYQHGFNLLPESDTYNNAGKTAEEIAASKIVKHSAVTVQDNESGKSVLRIKLATSAGDDLQKLTIEQLQGVTEYLARVGDAGVLQVVESNDPDSIKMRWTVYYDPLILNSVGSRLDGTDSEPVKRAIKSYLSQLPFNGVYVLQYHIDAVQEVDGVVICEIDEATTRYGDRAYQNVTTKMVPNAGYLRFIEENDLRIIYKPQSAIR